MADTVAQSPVSSNSFVPVPELETESTYKIAVPTRFNEDGSPKIFEYDKSVPVEAAMADLAAAFPRDAADTQIQLMTDPSFYKKMSFGDFQQWYRSKDAFDNSFDVSYIGLAYDTAKDILKGLGALGVQAAKAAYGAVAPGDGRAAARAAYNVAEGFMQGNERLFDLAKVLGTGAAKMTMEGIASVDPSASEMSQEAAYQAFIASRQMAETMVDRQTGKVILPQPAEGLTKADLDAINGISNVLDLSTFVPVGGWLAKGASSVAGDVAKNILPSVLINELAPRIAAKGLSITGSAIDKTTRFAFDQMSNIVSGVAEGAVGPGSKAVANVMSRTLVYGADMGTGGALIKSAVAGKAMKTAGEIGGVVIKALADGESVREGLQALGENTTKAASVRAAAKLAFQIAPPDWTWNSMKNIADAAVNTGVIMGGIGGMTAYASGQDPIHGFAEGAASGYGMGLVGGSIGELLKAPGYKDRMFAETLAKDIAGRPKTQTFNVQFEDGTVRPIEINDLQGRADFANRSDIPNDEKQAVLSILRASEAAGNQVVFTDSSDATKAAMAGAGLSGAEGIQIFNQGEGKSTIIVDPSTLSRATAIEETFHAVFDETVAKDTFNGIKEALKTQKPADVISEVSSFLEHGYLRELEANNQTEKAAAIRKIVETSKQPGLSEPEIISILEPGLNEYISNLAAQKLSEKDPKNLLPPKLRNGFDKAFDKTVGRVLSAFDLSKQGIEKDPVRGYFVDEKGDIAVSPKIASIIDDFTNTLREGRLRIESTRTVDGTTYYDVKKTSQKPWFSPEDLANNPKEAKQISAAVASDLMQIISRYGIDNFHVVTQEMRYQGGMFGNIPKDGKTVMWSKFLPKEAIVEMSGYEIAGKRVFSEEAIQAMDSINEAMKLGQILIVDGWHDVAKGKGPREIERYYGAANRTVLPVAWQIMPEGGLTVAAVDIGRIWHQVKSMAKGRTGKELAMDLGERNISSLQDFIPYLRQYFDNYSQGYGAASPAADLPGFTPAMRDAVKQSMNIKSIRKSFGERDASMFKNQLTFEAEVPTDVKMVRNQFGQLIPMDRESVTLLQIRAERLLGTGLFTRGGSPVNMRYVPENVTNLVRANFAPRRTRKEKLGSGSVTTDTENGYKIVSKDNQKFKLFDPAGKPAGVFESLQDAIDASNKIKLKQDNLSKTSTSDKVKEYQDKINGSGYIEDGGIHQISFVDPTNPKRMIMQLDDKNHETIIDYGLLLSKDKTFSLYSEDESLQEVTSSIKKVKKYLDGWARDSYAFVFKNASGGVTIYPQQSIGKFRFTQEITNKLYNLKAAIIKNKPLPQTKAEQSTKVLSREIGEGKFRETPISNTKVSGSYKLVDLDKLLTSDMEGFPQEFQPRQRQGNVSSQEQILQIAMKMQPHQLTGENRMTGAGPMTVIKTPEGKYMVLDGNGRAQGIRLASEKFKDSYQRYKDHLDQLGYGPGRKGILKPVEVFEITEPLSNDTMKLLAAESNQQTQMQFSVGEKAALDSQILDLNTLSLFTGADVTSEANSAFRKAFVQSLAQQERNLVLTKDGSLSAEGIRRIQSAMLARGYNSPQLTSKLLEQPDSNITTLGRAMVAAAPEFSMLRSQILDGKVDPGADMGSLMADAAGFISEARSAGENPINKLGTKDMFSPVSPELAEAVSIFHDQNKELLSQSKITDILKHIASTALEKDIQMDDMFGAQPVSKVDIIQAARKAFSLGEKPAPVFEEPAKPHEPSRAMILAREDEFIATFSNPTTATSARKDMMMKLYKDGVIKLSQLQKAEEILSSTKKKMSYEERLELVSVMLGDAINQKKQSLEKSRGVEARREEARLKRQQEEEIKKVEGEKREQERQSQRAAKEEERAKEKARKEQEKQQKQEEAKRIFEQKQAEKEQAKAQKQAEQEQAAQQPPQPQIPKVEMPEGIKSPSRETVPVPADSVPVVSADVPPNTLVVKTRAGKFKVLVGASAAVAGIFEDEKKAIKKAKQYAP